MGLHGRKREAAPVGIRFGRLVVVGHADIDGPGRARWECKCDCGKTKQILACNVKNGKSRSCGCQKGRHRLPVPIGERFGLLTVVAAAPHHGVQRASMWECRCECGQSFTTRASSIKGGHTQSCGCLARENARAKCEAMRAKRWPAKAG